jgi:hypothetical protein
MAQPISTMPINPAASLHRVLRGGANAPTASRTPINNSQMRDGARKNAKLECVLTVRTLTAKDTTHNVSVAPTSRDGKNRQSSMRKIGKAK